MNGGGQKHTLPRNKEGKGGVNMVNTDNRSQNHKLSRDKEAKGM